MLFAMMCHDKPNHLETRKSNREAHLAYVEETGVVVMAGPLLDDAGEMAGSLIILEMESLDAAKSWAANDPYAKADLFESVTLSAWKRLIG